jgi:rsbT co-antagonist protein RsbR
MAKAPTSGLPTILSESATQIRADWFAKLSATPDPRLSASEVESQCESILGKLSQASRDGTLTDINGPSFAPVRDILAEMSRTRAMAGFSSTETAMFILSLKQPLFARLQAVMGSDAERLAAETMTMNDLVDSLWLFMMEYYQRTREDVISRQQTEIAELSTPVVKLWQGILALPLIGTLDSARTQVVMENLLESIVRYEADIAIIDITGVPTVDTLVAQHLLKTVAAARLMGADCIISGIRPQIAQTMVHLGVELNVISKANLSDAFALALRRLGKTVVNQRRAAPVEPM